MEALLKEETLEQEGESVQASLDASPSRPLLKKKEKKKAAGPQIWQQPPRPQMPSPACPAVPATPLPLASFRSLGFETGS